MKNLNDKVNGKADGVGRVFKFTCLGVTLGFAAGAVGGVIGAEYLNKYVEFLNNSPKILQYAVDAGGALIGGGMGFFAGGAVSHLLGGYGNIFKDF